MGQLIAQGLVKRARQHNHPVLAALALSNDDGIAVEVNVLHSQRQPLHQAHARSVQQAGEQSGFAVDKAQQALHLRHGKDSGDASLGLRPPDFFKPRQFMAKHFPVQEKQRTQCLPVRGHGDLAFGRQHGQKCLDLRLAETARMPQAAEADEIARPVNVAMFRSQAVVKVSESLAQLAQQARRLQRRPKQRFAVFGGFFVAGHTYSITENDICSKGLRVIHLKPCESRRKFMPRHHQLAPQFSAGTSYRFGQVPDINQLLKRKEEDSGYGIKAVLSHGYAVHITLDLMNQVQLFRKVEERTFFAHHMLLHAAELEIADAEATERGRFNRCLAAMAMTALAVEGLANAVGSRVTTDYPTFERLRPHEKLDFLVENLQIPRNSAAEPWTTLKFLAGFRNDIAHPKPERVTNERVMPEAGLTKTSFETPLSALEREVTVGNAKRVFAAVRELKGLLADAMPAEARFGIYAEMWHGSTSPHEI